MKIDEIKEQLKFGESVNIEVKKAENSVPKSIYETYSAFANTGGGIIILGITEDKSDQKNPYLFTGVKDANAYIENIWNTLNGEKVSANILVDRNIYAVREDVDLVIIEVPMASYEFRPVYLNGNPFKSTFKRNNEGDFRCTEVEVRAMIRDQNPSGNDGLIMEGYSIDDIDMSAFRGYRQRFLNRQPEHIWNEKNDIEFLELLGAYKRNRKNGKEGLTMAGLLMFGNGLAIRDEFDQIFMDYRDESIGDERWSDRISYDGTWENNLFNFFLKVVPKITEDIKKPFKLNGLERVDDTPVHRAVREAFVNMIIHADYLMEGRLEVVKKDESITFTNPGRLKLPLDLIYKGGNSKTRNSRMQTMLRMIGLGDNAGSGFPAILEVWKSKELEVPKLEEDIELNQVKLLLKLPKEGDKLPKEGDKLPKEGDKLPKEGDKLPKEGDELPKEGDKLPKEGDKLPKEGNKLPKEGSRKGLSTIERSILNEMQINSKVTQKEIAEVIGIKRERCKYYIDKLKKANYLERKGDKRSGYWKVL